MPRRAATAIAWSLAGVFAATSAHAQLLPYREPPPPPEQPLAGEAPPRLEPPPGLPLAGEAPPRAEAPLAGEAPPARPTDLNDVEADDPEPRFRGAIDDTTELLANVPLAVDDPTLAPELRTRPLTADVTPGPYEPIGYRAGGLIYFPQLETSAVHSDNVFATPTDKSADWAAEFRPRLRVQSDWRRHSFTAEAGGLFSFHDEFETEDDRAYDARVAGRVDVTRRTNVELEVANSLTQEDRSSVDLPDAAAERTDLHATAAAIALNQRFNRLTLSGRFTASDFDYDDIRLNNGATANNDDRDFIEPEEAVRATWEFQPGVSAFVQGSHNDRNFKQDLDDDGFRRDSSGEEVQAGLTYRIGPTIIGTTGIGYAWQRPVDSTFDDIEGIVIDSDIIWRPSDFTSLRFTAQTDVAQTTLIDSAGALVRQYGLALQHTPREHIVLGASLAYQMADYIGGSLEEQVYIAGLTAEYFIKRGIAFTAAYQFVHFLSTAPDSDYDENEFRLGMKFQL